MKNSSFAHFAHFYTFRIRFCPIDDVKWPVWQLCGWHEHVTTNFQHFSSNLQTAHSNLIPRIWRTHFVRQMTWNNREMIVEIRNYILRWRSRCSRHRRGWRSLMMTPALFLFKYPAEQKPIFSVILLTYTSSKSRISVSLDPEKR